MATEYKTKSGKKFDAPSLFVNPQTEIDAAILRATIQSLPSQTAYINGIVVGLKDWRAVRRGLNADQAALFETLGINDRVKIVDNSLHILFQGASQDKESLMNVEIDGKRIGDFQLIAGGQRVRDVVLRIKSLDPSQRKEKIEHYIKELYPYMDLLIQPLMKFSIEEGSDFVVVPSVPLSISTGLLELQIEKARSMNKAGKVFANTLFGKSMEKRDLMFMITLSPTIVKPEYFDQIASTIIIEEEGKETVYPDQIGIRIMHLDKNNTDSIQSLLEFITHLATMLKARKKQIPIHLFNVREFGYVTFCYGATTMTTPMAKSPYMQIYNSNKAKPDMMGRYYHPIDMEDYTYEKSLALSRHANYRLPCHCVVCDSAQNFLAVKDDWNSFRRRHFLLVKHMEIAEIKNAPAITLYRHLQQRFSRSKQTLWLAFLDKQTILTFK
jgi:hypothetical protein